MSLDPPGGGCRPTAGIAAPPAPRPGCTPGLDRVAALAAGLSTAARDAHIPLTINRVGSMMTPFFTSGPVINYDDVLHSNKDRYNAFFHRMLNRGIYLAPSAFEALFVSFAHSDDDIRYTIDQARISFEE